jgi:hypothetical protein
VQRNTDSHLMAHSAHEKDEHQTPVPTHAEQRTAQLKLTSRRSSAMIFRLSELHCTPTITR